jgi:4-hydroxy-4-methyl-2-oxoglutarate aldolase
MGPNLSDRLRHLYTGVVADVLDVRGRRNQVLPGAISPIADDMWLAGPAYPGRGEPTADSGSNDMERRLEMLEGVPPGSVSIWDCGGHGGSAHWGEIMSLAARGKGGVGAVIDGGVRDTDFMLEMGFPVFARFRSPASSIGRWEIVEWGTEIRIGETLIQPGDWVLGDIDGIVVIPQAELTEVVEEAEAKMAAEEAMRKDLATGIGVKEAFHRHGSL